MTVLFHGRFTCGWCRTAWRHSFNPTTGETMIHWLRWHRHVMENGWIFPLRKLYGDLPTHRIHGAGIYANIGGILMVNVAIYSIHGSYGQRITVCRPWKNHQTHLAQYIYIYINRGYPQCRETGKIRGSNPLDLEACFQTTRPGKHTKSYWSHGHRNSGCFPIENGGSFHSFLYVYQRVTHIAIAWMMPFKKRLGS